MCMKDTVSRRVRWYIPFKTTSKLPSKRGGLCTAHTVLLGSSSANCYTTTVARLHTSSICRRLLKLADVTRTSVILRMRLNKSDAWLLHAWYLACIKCHYVNSRARERTREEVTKRITFPGVRCSSTRGNILLSPCIQSTAASYLYEFNSHLHLLCKNHEF